MSIVDKYACVKIHESTFDNDFETLAECLCHRINASNLYTDAIDRLKEIVKLDTFPDNFTVFIEFEYVDRVYRDIFYHHYASRHAFQERNCVRVFFFDYINESDEISPDEIIEKTIGVCVIQPNGIIGRSYWVPCYFMAQGSYVRTTNFTFSFLGEKISIDAFPYMMQDREATTCAEVTVLNLIDYYSKSYQEYGLALLSDIEQVESKHNAQRIFPSHGMNYADVARSLMYVGLSPRIYANRLPLKPQCEMQRYIYQYIESGIPFGIAVQSQAMNELHSVVCVGHGPRKENWLEESSTNYLSVDNEHLEKCWIANSADAYSCFIIMDDNDRPYQRVSLTSATKKWFFPRTDSEEGIPKYAVEQLCIPLYKRVFLEADGAAEIFTSVLTSRIGFHAVINKLSSSEAIEHFKNIGAERSCPLIIRTFLASSTTFLQHRIHTLSLMGRKMDEQYVDVYQNLFCPRFVWVCELYTPESFNSADSKVIGEIVVDATAHRSGFTNGLESIVLIHYPGFITYNTPGSNWIALQENQIITDTWTPFEPFHGNLKG